MGEVQGHSHVKLKKEHLLSKEQGQGSAEQKSSLTATPANPYGKTVNELNEHRQADGQTDRKTGRQTDRLHRKTNWA